MDKLQCSNDQYPVHQSVYQNDVEKLKRLIDSRYDLNKIDLHGNTALHLATMLCRFECLELLCSNNATIFVRNAQGWTPIDVAISYSDRKAAFSLLQTCPQQICGRLENMLLDFKKMLEEIGEFSMTLNWDISSYIPGISAFLPSGSCKILKNGRSLRMDITFMCFNKFRWTKENLSILYRGNAENVTELLFVLDNKRKITYNCVKGEQHLIKDRRVVLEQMMEDYLDYRMSSPKSRISTKDISISSVKSGWFSKKILQTNIGNYVGKIYKVTGIVLETKEITENLASKNTAQSIKRPFPKRNSQMDNKKVPSIDLETTPPQFEIEPKISWDEYISSPAEKALFLGNIAFVENSKHNFKAKLAMCENFPLKIDTLLKMLTVIASHFKEFNKLKEFIEKKLPPGFPIQFELSILSAFKARVNFPYFAWMDGNASSDSMFEIPTDYEEWSFDWLIDEFSTE